MEFLKAKILAKIQKEEKNLFPAKRKKVQLSEFWLSHKSQSRKKEQRKYLHQLFRYSVKVESDLVAALSQAPSKRFKRWRPSAVQKQFERKLDVEDECG